MTNIKPNIANLDDLDAEKQRLKAEIKMRKADIGGSFGEIKDEFNPLNLFRKKRGGGMGGKVAGLFNPAGNSRLVSMGVATAANFILKKVVLRKAGFLPRLLLPIVVRKASNLIVAPKVNRKIVSAMYDTADAIRNTDVEDIAPTVKDAVPDKALKAVAKTSNNIANKLYSAADTIRPEDKPDTLYTPSLLKKRPGRKIAKKLHKLADRIRS